MPDQRMVNFQNLVEAVLTTPGETSSNLRTRLAQEAAHFIDSGAGQPEQVHLESSFQEYQQKQEAIPPELESYVNKVARYAYRVTDEDIEMLRQKGYSEDKLFEITLSVALGSAKHCLTQGLAALQGAEETCA